MTEPLPAEFRDAKFDQLQVLPTGPPSAHATPFDKSGTSGQWVKPCLRLFPSLSLADVPAAPPLCTRHSLGIPDYQCWNAGCTS